MNNQIEQISNNISEVTLEDVNKAFHQGIEEFYQNSSQHLERIKILINNLIYNIEYFQGMSKLVPKGNVDASQKLLELKRVLIYKDFFELQNLINAFIYQKIIMTYVHVDPQTGMREIRLFDNDIKNLSSTIVNSHGRTYAKLGYELQSHYQLLKNSLPEESNFGLQLTAKEVEERYKKYKGRILWKINSDWMGYKLYNRGPINEAFVDFYLKNIQLENSLNDFDYFMRSYDPQGVINADNANGFLIGDISIGGLQFAVKGAYGSPQNFAMIMKWLKEVRDQNFSNVAFLNFINRFKEEEQQKATKLVKPLTKKSVDSLVRYHKDKLLTPLASIKP